MTTADINFLHNDRVKKDENDYMIKIKEKGSKHENDQ